MAGRDAALRPTIASVAAWIRVEGASRHRSELVRILCANSVFSRSIDGEASSANGRKLKTKCFSMEAIVSRMASTMRKTRHHNILIHSTSRRIRPPH